MSSSTAQLFNCQPANVVTVADGWQTECWKLTKKRVAFLVVGSGDLNRRFCDELSLAYRYQLNWLPTEVLFTPLEIDPELLQSPQLSMATM